MTTGKDTPEPEEGWELVAEVARDYEADFMAGRLRESGIDARVVDKSFHQEPVPTARAFAIVRVYVPADQAEEARRILDNPGGSEGPETDEKS
jgi:hypothetical protein